MTHINLPSTVNELQNSIKNAIEFYQGSPVKNQNKLNESTAKALGFDNYDQLSAALREKEKESDSDNELYFIVTENFTSYSSFAINGTPINDFIFENELFNYKFVEREEIINDLITWISEGNNQAHLMKEDLKYLMTLNDDIILSSILTNEYIAKSDQPEEFNELCSEILEIQTVMQQKDDKNLS